MAARWSSCRATNVGWAAATAGTLPWYINTIVEIQENQQTDAAEQEETQKDPMSYRPFPSSRMARASIKPYSIELSWAALGNWLIPLAHVTGVWALNPGIGLSFSGPKWISRSAAALARASGELFVPCPGSHLGPGSPGPSEAECVVWLCDCRRTRMGLSLRTAQASRTWKRRRMCWRPERRCRW